MNEKSLIVLDQYDIKVFHTYRGRGVYLCDTDKGLKLLKERKGSKTKAFFQKRAVGYMRKQGLLTEDIVENKNGELLTEDKDQTIYVLKDWVEGKECDIRQEEQMQKAAKELAFAHLALAAVPSEENENYKGTDLLTEYEKHNRELRQIQNYIRKKKKKTDFELYFYNHMGAFYEKGCEVLEQLQESDYEQLYQMSVQNGSVCHGDFHQHNVMIGRDGTAIVNFEACRTGVQIGDLYLFMRKALEKSGWKPEIGKNIIASYHKIRPLTDAERTNLWLQLSYPEKFWKIANHYYHSNKVWIPEKDFSKLQTVLSQESAKQECLEELKMVL